MVICVQQYHTVFCTVLYFGRLLILSRILMHGPTFIGNRTQSSFPMSAKSRRNTSTPGWTIAVIVVVLWGKEAKVVLQNLAGSPAKKSGKSYCETSNFMKSRINILFHVPNEPTSTVIRWTTNITQNWTKGFIEKKPWKVCRKINKGNLQTHGQIKATSLK